MGRREGRKKEDSPLTTGLRRRAGVAGGHGAAGRREGTTRRRALDPPQGRGLGEGLAEHCACVRRWGVLKIPFPFSNKNCQSIVNSFVWLTKFFFSLLGHLQLTSDRLRVLVVVVVV